MQNDNYVPLDKIFQRMMKDNKPYVFTIDPCKGEFIDPEKTGGGFALGVQIDEVSTLRLREIWLKSGDGESFLLHGQYNIYRFPKLIEFMKETSEVWAPVVRLDGIKTGLQFVDGRHRFLWFLIHEYETMSIVVDRHEELAIRKLLGR
jgi:hypothetical protein